MLRAALDATSCHPPWIYAVGGLVGSPEAWDELVPQWQEALAKWRIQRFHLSELPKLVGRERTKMCEGYFRRLLADCELDTVGAAIFTAHWGRSDWGHDQSPRFNTAYEQSLWFALTALGQHCKERFPEQEVVILCDADAPKAAIGEILKKVQEQHPSLGSMTISTSAKRIELQCADLAAGYLRRSWVEISENSRSEMPWGRLPKTKGKTRSSVWSLAPSFFIGRALRLHELGIDGDD